MSGDNASKERRKYPRIRKNYIIRFTEKANPALKYEVSQIENISRGGICFTSTVPFKQGTTLSVELRTPYIADTIYLEGYVLESHEKVKGLIYHNRFQFHEVTPLAVNVLEKIEKYNINLKA
ncbi:MAG: PilZ domain-containing protein [Candidatus Omnitrophica bacterium]|nr:PilZ domain-containing protein [Candidatus Omnitrophota bacterium]